MKNTDNIFLDSMKMGAINFALWLNRNRWFNFDEKSQKWCYTFEGGTSLGRGTYEKNYMKTSDELFELFMEDERNKIDLKETIH